MKLKLNIITLVLNIFTLIVLSLILIGCGDVYPVPEKAVKACIDKGWEVKYTSKLTSSGTTFECNKPIRKGR
jgi:hypothetical protein